MFNKTHSVTVEGIENAVPLIFLKSSHVKVFPCGRRRSNQINMDGARIPFDPEARLNTEANNIKHSGLNGFTQTYLSSWNKDNDGKIVLSIAGYLFEIATSFTPTAFMQAITELNATFETAETVYANILLEHTPLYIDEALNYYTYVLGSQASSADDSKVEYCLDISIDDTDDLDNYYFSGLSFSAQPRTGKTDQFITETATDIGKIVSLKLLTNTAGTWEIFKPALLPKIEHGTTDDSVAVEEATVRKNLTVNKDINVAETGNIILDNGNINVTKGNVNLAEGRVVVTTGGVTVNTGDIKVLSGNITVEDDNGAITSKGNLTVHKTANTANLNVTTNAKIHNNTNSATAEIDKATIQELNVHKSDSTAIANADQVIVTGTASNNNITVRASSANDAAKTIITSDKVTSTTIEGTTINGTTKVIGATFETASGGTNINTNKVTSGTITANVALCQKRGDDTMQVPIIELVPIPNATDPTSYQLKITRVGKAN